MKKVFNLLIVCIVVITLCACGKQETKKSKEENKKQEVAKDVQIIDVNSKTRPYAVMINCHNDGLPQSGLQDAYIVYELMVEGGITRMMALFKDVDVDKIGSIRSARTQYLDYVKEHDAIYVHAGGATDAMIQISNDGISDVNVDNDWFGFRDYSLPRPSWHTLFTSTDLIKNGANDESINLNTDSGNLLKYSVTPVDFSKYKDTKDANYVSIKYSYYRTSNYTYDSNKKVYLRAMNDINNVDLVTGNSYEIKNIIVYGVNYSNYTYEGNSQYQKIDNVGSGEGYYISEGVAVPIIWEKNSKNEKTIYKIKETGKELIVNDGNTYIQIYPSNQPLVIK